MARWFVYFMKSSQIDLKDRCFALFLLIIFILRGICNKCIINCVWATRTLRLFWLLVADCRMNNALRGRKIPTRIWCTFDRIMKRETAGIDAWGEPATFKVRAGRVLPYMRSSWESLHLRWGSDRLNAAKSANKMTNDIETKFLFNPNLCTNWNRNQHTNWPFVMQNSTNDEFLAKVMINKVKEVTT